MKRKRQADIVRIYQAFQFQEACGQKRKINWRAYNKQLVQRGSLTVFFSEDIAHNWYNTSPKGSGFQKVYTDTAIKVLAFNFVYTTQGFAESLVRLIPACRWEGEFLYQTEKDPKCL